MEEYLIEIRTLISNGNKPVTFCKDAIRVYMYLRVSFFYIPIKKNLCSMVMTLK